mgnify:CR=1 FL=1|tara:strand:+ start:200 stop:478 length:279 start_codon:yes stop_codon:yes gene_type:complete
MATTEYDLMFDGAAEKAFPYLDEINNNETLEEHEMINALIDEFDMNLILAENLVSSWNSHTRNKKMADGLKEPHPAHKNRIKILNTVIKEIL